MRLNANGVIFAALATSIIATVSANTAAAQVSVYEATLAEQNQKTPEISTEEMRRVLAHGSTIVIDARKHPEFLAGHIPGAKSTMQASSVDRNPSLADVTVRAVNQIVGGDKSKAIVLYCDGPQCLASKALGEVLVAAGFTNVRRYQLGIPMWRTLSGPVEIELDGILRIYKIDQTAVFFDARSAQDFSRQSLPGTYNVPADKLVTEGLGKAPLPVNDFNTRIVLFGRDAAQARALADAMAKTPWQNVSYFPGTFEELAAAVKSR